MERNNTNKIFSRLNILLALILPIALIHFPLLFPLMLASTNTLAYCIPLCILILNSRPQHVEYISKYVNDKRSSLLNHIIRKHSKMLSSIINWP